MSLMNKLKNLFTDEVEEQEEIELEEKTEKPKLPTVMQEEMEKKVIIKEVHEKVVPEEFKREEFHRDGYRKENTMPVNNTEVKNTNNTNNRFNFPIEFNEKDWTSIKPKKPLYSGTNPTTQTTRTKELYNTKLTLKKEPEKEKFTCSPIISPVYGILDKNYSKEDVQAKDLENYQIPRASTSIDFESIRKKAFGTLTDELKDNLMCEDCELLKRQMQNLDNNNDLLGDIVDNNNEDSTIDDNLEDFGVLYDKEDEKIEEISPIKIDVEVENNIYEYPSRIEILNHNEEPTIAEKIEVRETPKTTVDTDFDIYEDTPITETRSNSNFGASEDNDSKKPKDEKLDLTEDLYNLIDSMYEERP